MPNASTIKRQVGGTQQLTLAPLLGSVISTTETAFQLNNNALTLQGGGVVPLSTATTSLFLSSGVSQNGGPIVALYAGSGQKLHLLMTGTVTGATAATTTLILKMYEVPASLLPIANTLAGAQTFTGWHVMATSSTRTLATAQSSWEIEARIQMDGAGNINGEWTDTINSQIDAWANITAITGLAGEADLNFAVTATLGGAETGVSVIPGEFQMYFE